VKPFEYKFDPTISNIPAKDDERELAIEVAKKKRAIAKFAQENDKPELISAEEAAKAKSFQPKPSESFGTKLLNEVTPDVSSVGNAFNSAMETNYWFWWHVGSGLTRTAGILPAAKNLITKGEWDSDKYDLSYFGAPQPVRGFIPDVAGGFLSFAAVTGGIAKGVSFQ
jgi:hypothetical protein